jgi:hypothetical protein
VPWGFTGFYGHSDQSKRHEAWALLSYLRHSNPGPWLCIGDFNEVFYATEKWGGWVRSSSQMNAFHHVLDKCQLADLGYRGAKYTWCNFREGKEFIKERLDKGVANSRWRDLFPEAEIIVDGAIWSDHSPLLLCLSSKHMQRGNPKMF